MNNLAIDGSIKINISEISPAAFKGKKGPYLFNKIISIAILEDIYFGKVALTKPLALELLTFTDKFGIPQLKADCEVHLSANLKAVNLLDVIKVTETVKLEKLKDEILSFVAGNMKLLEQEIDVSLIPQEILAKAVSKLKVPQK